MTKSLVRQTALKQITSHHLKHIDWQPLVDFLIQFNTVSLYQSLASEFDLQTVQKRLIAHKVLVAYPAVLNGQMVMINTHDQDDFEFKSGFLQPNSGDVVVPDVVVCSLLAINQQGYRLGRGGGYYDRYLAAHTLQCFGIAYDWQQNMSFTPDIWDMPLDGCFFVDNSGTISQKNY